MHSFQPPPNRGLTINLKNAMIYCGCCWKWIKDPDVMYNLGTTVISNYPPLSGFSPCHLGPPHLSTIMSWDTLTMEDFMHDCPGNYCNKRNIVCGK